MVAALLLFLLIIAFLYDRRCTHIERMAELDNELAGQDWKRDHQTENL
jgi:hypothetical protein